MDSPGLRLTYGSIELVFKPGDLAGLTHDPVEAYSAYAGGSNEGGLKDRHRK